MKNIKLLFMWALLLYIISPSKILPQSSDTLVVPWADQNGDVIINSLRETIANDTLRPAGRVYKLQRGGFYWITDPIQNDGFPLVIVGETEADVPEGEIDYGPAIIQRVAREDGSEPAATMFESYDDLTVKNVWIMGQTDQGNLATYEPIKLLGDGKKYIFDNVIFDRNDWHHLGPDGPNNDFIITNCKFRNLFGPTQIWEGLGIRFEVGADTVIFENNTFFNIGFTPFQSEAVPINYFRVNHNTFVNIGRSFSAGSIWKTIYVTNNLFVNYFWAGESYEQYTDPDREDPHTGFFSIAELPAKFGTNLERKIVLVNNGYWRDPKFDQWYENSTTPVRTQPIRPQPLVNDTTKGWFNAWDNMLMQGNIEANPQLTVYPTDDIFDKMTATMDSLFADEGSLTVSRSTLYYWDPGRDENCYQCNIWPLPEDFSYSNADLLTAGTDGLPLGDLNWFPEKKEQFLANYDQYVSEIENLVSAVELEVVESVEAEDGTLSGDAAVLPFEGFTYFDMQGGGYIEWEFELAEAGQYDLNIWTNLNGNSTRGQRIIVNGVSIHDPMNWGEYIWSPTEHSENIWYGKFDPNEWVWTLIKQEEILEAGALTLPAGKNTIRIESSWGYQLFAGIDVIPAGSTTPVVELRAPDAKFDIVTLKSEGAPFVPSQFKSVALNTNGSVALNLSAPEDGIYRLRIFYQNYMGNQSIQLSIDGQVINTVLLPSKDDSTGADVITDGFSLTQGTHTIMLSGSNVNIDYINLLKEIGTGVNDNEIPNGYALEQNFPNPFNPTTSIKFTLAKPEVVKLTVYNILGQRVATLVNGPMTAGQHIVHFNASNLASGIYFYGIEAGSFKTFKKMILLK
ncbi:T9SS type A sorting domain-containing protein [Melioribacter sp. Ez-97]|uniref:T9SS type A sorting domain-containing protein n=1 Tax=Melioribacter sp. Ez-97 TaxID=3423434 RepID=UPI003EDA2537